MPSPRVEPLTSATGLPAPFRPGLLDLCCGGGGASVGYAVAGFDVCGVDIVAQPDYPFGFQLADALTIELDGFDLVHVSPPCPRFSRATPSWARDRWPDLIGPLRERLRAAVLDGRIGGYVIENVPGAPLRSPVQLCGSAFGLGVQRHRLFESSWQLAGTGCAHSGEPVHVYGSEPPQGVQAAREAMGVPWLPWSRLVNAIPPAYTEFLGRQIMRHLAWSGSVSADVGVASCSSMSNRHDELGQSVTSTAAVASLSAPAKRHGPPAETVTAAGRVASARSSAFRRFVVAGGVTLVDLDPSRPRRGCLNCGEPVTVAPTGRIRRYCSQGCRQAAYRDRRRLDGVELP